MIAAKPKIGGIISPEQVRIQFDESHESMLAISEKQRQERQDQYNSRNESIELRKKQFTYVKKIEELETELAIAKEKLMIGSQIIKNLVNDTKDSFTYFQ